MTLRAAIFGLLATTGLQAQTLTFASNANLQLETGSAFDSYSMPVGIWDRGDMPTRQVEGQLTQQAWRLEAAGLTTLQILRPLREQLRDAGYDVIFECQTEACGGFDFRFSVATLPPPEMEINIGDFRFLAAEKQTEAGAAYLSLFVSRSARAGFVQITRVTPAAGDAIALPDPTTQLAAKPQRAVPADLSILEKQLNGTGSAVLSDLAFDTGSSELALGDFASLQALADFLTRYPDRTVALVGHTDATGSLNANIALSKQRAGSVLDRLVSAYGVDRSRLAAEGMGYLAPIASNQTAAGRDANRRVAVIVTSTTDN